jgi:hypothetical protein
MNIQAINTAIITGGLSNAELDSIIDAVKFRRAQIVRVNTVTFRTGDRVKFTSNRNGQVYTGTVRKVAIKNIIVDTPLGGYKVPANMLQAA